MLAGRASCLPLIALLAQSPVFAQSEGDAAAGLVDSGQQLERLSAELEASFDAALDDFDRDILERPFDVALRVQRCRFIEAFAYQYEYEIWIDRVYALSEACDGELQAGWPDHPEVILNSFEYLYGESLLEAAAPYDYPPNRPGWTAGQLSRLYETLAQAADVTGNPDAGAFARRAVELDARASVRLLAAESLAADGMREQALAMLHSPLVPRDPADDPWNATREMALLAALGERERLLELYRRLQDSDAYYDAGEAARSLSGVGEIELARTEFAAATEYASFDDYAFYEWFNFELSFGTGTDAMAAYEQWRANGWGADPVGANRVALFFRDPSLPLLPRDLLGLVGAVLAVLLIGLAACVAIVPIHYRGAVLRARQQLLPDTTGWRLRHAWYALFAMGLTSLVSVYGVGAIDIASVTNTGSFSVADGESLARFFLIAEFALLALLIPLCRISVGAPRYWATTFWSPRKCLLIAVGLALALRLPFFVYHLALPGSTAELVSSSIVWEMVNAVRERYGVFAALWLVAAVAPVAEEIIFRGVLLRSFSKNVSFALANTAQAGLFALMHFDLAATPMLFVLGLAAGFLARRSGGLLAPITLHAGFNLILGLYVLIPGPSP